MTRGSDNVAVNEEETSCRANELTQLGGPESVYLFEQVGGQHQHLSIWPETLCCSQVAHAFLQILLTGHDLQHMKRCPRHIVTKHFEVYEFQQGSGFQIHIGTFDFGTTFSQAVLDVSSLVALVVSQSAY